MIEPLIITQSTDSTTLIIAIITTITSIVSVAIAIWALITARQTTRATQLQADRAEEANRHSRQLGQSEAVIHFSSRYFDLLKDGHKFRDVNWTYQFWSLHATEFYFFHQKWLPLFIYQLWMVELAGIYSQSAEAWNSHEKYLSNYSANYAEMTDFFREISNIGMQYRNDLASRNRKVEMYVADSVKK